jgi:hypothetical protein
LNLFFISSRKITAVLTFNVLSAKQT